MKSSEIRQRFLDFFVQRGHKIVPSASLIPTDPSVLLTTAGMQQFKSYYTGASDALKDFGSKNVVSIQKSFRTSDIDEVGDDSHLTFFEMLGNFSFGGYGKKEAIEYAHEFITQELGLEIDYVTIFVGDSNVGKDEESKKIWQKLKMTDIRECGREDNFWGPTGSEGPCGPTTEIYVDGIEIWNLVFNEYHCEKLPARRQGGENGSEKLERLKTFGVDTGMGLERLAMVVQKKVNIFETDLFASLISKLPASMPERAQRIIADHTRAISFLIVDGVRPSNKGAGYILRRLMRRVIAYNDKTFYPELDAPEIIEVFNEEKTKYSEALRNGLRELGKLSKIDAVTAFKLYESYGLPFEVIKDRYPDLSRTEFEKEFEQHQTVSRAGIIGKFTGGLADHEPKTIKLHTAHHLLLASLQQMFGKQVKQRGSNINQERLRLDFSFDRKLTDEEKKRVEDLVNQKIAEDLVVTKKEMSKTEAEKLGAEMEFGQKYGETVSVYSISDFSLEFCGGPHVARTSDLGSAVAGRGAFKIIKDEPVAQGIRRIKAVLEN